LTEENRESLIEKSLKILSSGLDNEELLEEFNKVCVSIVSQLSIDFIIDEVLQEVFPLYQLKNKLENRIWAATILLAIVKVIHQVITSRHLEKKVS